MEEWKCISLTMISRSYLRYCPPATWNTLFRLHVLLSSLSSLLKCDLSVTFFDYEEIDLFSPTYTTFPWVSAIQSFVYYLSYYSSCMSCLPLPIIAWNVIWHKAGIQQIEGVGKSRFIVVSSQNTKFGKIPILVSIYYCVIFVLSFIIVIISCPYLWFSFRPWCR